MIDIYYKKPVLFDFIISAIVIGFVVSLDCYNLFKLPDSEKSSDFASDIGAIGLTISGFILTLITILISLKSGQVLLGEKLTNSSSPFKIFLASPLYVRSIDILKYGVFSLVLVSFAIFILKLALDVNHLKYIFYGNVLGLVIILMTFLRCFYVIGIIMQIQNHE
jgi:hypothetical protein